LAHARAGSRVAVLAADVDCAAAVDVTAWVRHRTVQAVEIVGFQVRVHVSETDDLVAHVAFRRPPSIGNFVGCHSGEQSFGVWNVWVAFLWDDQVAEAAESEFCRADGCAVAGE
jgi:hypothetical protein